MNRIKKIFLMIVIFSSLLFSTVIEDAEDGTTNGWIVSSGATISNVTDDETDSKVIKLSSSSYKYYKIKNLNDSATTIKWDIKANSGFLVYIFVMTTDGNRLFYYTISNRDRGVTGSGIHHGLNQEVTDGTWHTIDRDLESELHESEPDNSILKITSFKIRSTGDVFVDNIESDGSSPTPTPTSTCIVIEDAEDGTTSGWIASSGATVSNVTDDETESKVIKLSSSSYKYFKIKNLNNVSKKIKWDIKANSGFIIYLSVLTDEGNRLFYYSISNRDNGVTGSGIHHGLKQELRDGTWHTIERDLEAELQESEPDNFIVKITSFKIRSTGDVFVDNIRGCDGTLPPSAPTLTTDVPIETTIVRLTVEVNGEAESKVFLNAREVAGLGSDGKVWLGLSLKIGDNSFSITLKDAQGNESGALDFSVLRKVRPPKKITLKKTGQLLSYNEAGDEVAYGSIKDDGYYQKGVEPSYTRDDDKEIVTDHITGLMWQDDAAAINTGGEWFYNDVSIGDYCWDLELGGYRDWGFPTVRELQSIAANLKVSRTVFVNFNSYSYWSSTRNELNSNIWYVSPFGSGGTGQNEETYENYVRCVRRGQ